MRSSLFRPLTLVALSLLAASSLTSAASPFVGRWALTIPGGGAGWLGIEEKDGALKGSLLWGGGSVVPVQEVNRLLNQFEQMQKMMKMMRSGGLGKMMRNMKGMPPGMR